jgi:D-sedoheptulose 7-phosphate isomerase
MSRLRTIVANQERVGLQHLAAASRALDDFVDELPNLERWGRHLAGALVGGHRLLVAGNGGSAAQAQHLTSELVGRYDRERMPLSAIALHAESSTLTALLNDYSAEEVFARQVRAHGRHGDVFLAISTSGRSPNVVTAAQTAHELGMWTLALTAGRLTPLERACDETVRVNSSATATVQEVHQVAIHIFCEALETEVAALQALERQLA